MTANGLALPVSERDFILGDIDAPVTLLEYGDYQCSDCAKFHALLAGIMERVGPKVRFVHRHMPWTKIHPHAQAAAEASLAAGAQGRFWEMHDRLYSASPRLSQDDLKSYASELGLDVEHFAQELAQGTHKARVLEDVRSAVRSGVKRTPTLFINGQAYAGDIRDVDALVAAIEEAAAAAAG